MTADQHDKLAIRSATAGDAASIATIYNYYITNTVISFEEEAVSTVEMAARIQEVQSLYLPWLVVTEGKAVLGYAYAAKWRVRHAYRFAVEVSVYLDPLHSRRGLGSMLYSRLLADLESLGTTVAIGGIALPNEASVRLHERQGFHKVAHFEKVGFKLGRWIDVGYWQRSL